MESPLFLQTKLHPSQVAPRSLSRARLIRELKRESQVRLLLVTGPAGSGKSTLMADYLVQRLGKSAWLGLGEEDLDPQVFLNYFLESLCQTYPGSVEQTRNRFGTAANLDESTQAGVFLINELVEYGEPVAIVLDDYHLVDSQPAINALMKLLIKRGPTNLTIMITSRDVPDLPLSWLRAKRLMTEVHQEDLRFTVAETAELFSQVWGQSLEDDLVRLLVDKTEGWATGLQLVAQAIRNRTAADVRRYVQNFQGADTNVFDYLIVEVFEAQPQKVQDFLELTSLPDTFSPDLAQHLVPVCDAPDVISHLKNSRLFLVELDRSGEWYRYHHLFRDFLRKKLRVDRSRPFVESLHHRTATWLLEHDEVVACVPHFLSCGDPELAADILGRVGSDLLTRGLRTSVARWLEVLPASLRHARPDIMVLQAELFDLQGHWPRAVEGYRAALAYYRDSGEAVQLASVLEKLSLCYIKYGENQLLLESCEEGLKLCPPENRALRALLETWLGSCLISSGQDWDRGYELIRSSHFLAFECKDPRAISWACMGYGFVYHFPQGNFEEAIRTLSEGIDMFSRLGWPMAIYQLTMNKSLIQILQGDPVTALTQVDETLLAARRAGHSFVEKGLECVRAMAYLESGRLTECRETLEKLGQAEIASQVKPWFFRSRMLLNCSEQNYGQARVDAEEMERSLLLSGPGMYAPECFVSLAYLLICQGDLAEAQHRLQMSLRVCEKARAKFWKMKTLQMLAWKYLQDRDTVKFRATIEECLELTQTNDYTFYWVSDGLRISIPLLVAAVAYQTQVTYAEKLLARLNSRLVEEIEGLVQHVDPSIRKVAIRYLGRSSRENARVLLKQVYRADPDAAVREEAKKSLKVTETENRLKICCLGKLQIATQGGDNLDLARTLRPLATRMLKYFLTYPDKVVASEQLLDVFWPDSDPEKARHSLATQLSVIRRSLGIQNLFPRVGDGYRLYGNLDIVIDVLEFDRNARLGLELVRQADDDDGMQALARAEALYQGDFLEEDLYDDWVEWRRRELREQFEEVIETQGDYFARHGQNEQALTRYRKLLDGEEPQERVFHKLFRCYEALGDRQGARKDYESFRARLKKSLGLEPQPATRALIEALFLRD